MTGLGLTPEQFWSLTPVELALMLGIDPVSAPMTRSRLAALAAAWPDRHSTTEDLDDGQERSRS
ncbi:phage tail assembly chaperone [Paracoccus aurantiacus]